MNLLVAGYVCNESSYCWVAPELMRSPVRQKIFWLKKVSNKYFNQKMVQ